MCVGTLHVISMTVHLAGMQWRTANLPREAVLWSGTALLACCQPPSVHQCCPSPSLPGKGSSSSWHLLRRGNASRRYICALLSCWRLVTEAAAHSRQILAPCNTDGKAVKKYSCRLPNGHLLPFPTVCAVKDFHQHSGLASLASSCCAGAGEAIRCGCDLQQIPAAPRSAAGCSLCSTGS